MNIKKPIVLNMFGGPGSGKSVVACGVFSILKMHGINTEIVTEFAKDLVWEGRDSALANQYYVFGEQHHRVERLKDKVDVIITDSPILLNIVYGKLRNAELPSTFYKTVKEAYENFNNMNYFILRNEKYTQKGRLESKEESDRIDEIILKEVLNKYIYCKVKGDYTGINEIVENVLKIFKIKSKLKINM